MKKITRVTVVVCLMMLAVFAFSTSAFAAAKSAVQTKADKETNSLTNYGEYWGWTKTVTVKTNTTNKVVKEIKLVNTKYNFLIDQTTQKSGGQIVTVFKIKGAVYSATGIKKSLKQYSVKNDRRTVVEDKAGLLADSLMTTATKNNWTVAERKTSYKSGIATVEQKFQNSKYQFTATVKVTRKSGKLQVSYLRSGKACKKSDITSWLKTYKTSTAAGNNNPTPGTTN